MSLKHKAFLFDTQRFRQELAPVIISSGREGDPESLREFVFSHIGQVRSPYTGDPLGKNWEKKLEKGGVQELADFAMTCYYDPQENRGLGYAWEALMEALRRLTSRVDHEYVILGSPLRAGAFVLDPGRKRTGFVQADDVPTVHAALQDFRRDLTASSLPPLEDLFYELSPSDLLVSFDQLLALYRDARESKRGLLITF